MVRALARSARAPSCSARPATPGSPPTPSACRVAADDVEAIVAAATERGIDLVAIGPEAALVAGAVDVLERAGIPAFGPTAAAADLEGSKAFAKELMKEAGVPTAGHVLLRSREEALEHVARAPYPTVLKADGLAAGKGVILAATETEARAAIDVFFTERRFGETVVVLEEFLEGEELSLLALCDGENVVPLAPAQDYKRIFDGDEGPNTGGMGSYSPVPGFGPAEVEEIVDSVHRPVVAAMARRGIPFHGVLYAGLMIGPDGPKVLEFNARFGDPETQAVLPRLRSDLVDLFLAAREPGGLAGMSAEFSEDWAVTLVLASAGYPESSSKGDVIHGLDAAAELAEVTHAGTAERDGRDRHRRRPRAQRHRARTDASRGARSCVRCGQPDLLRRNADPQRHRRPRRRARPQLNQPREEAKMSEISEPPPTGSTGSAEPTTMPAVEEAFEEIDVDEPLVGIIMGSKNDKPKMQPAGAALHDAGIRYEVRVMSAHRDPEAVREYCTNAKMRGLKVIIAGRRDVGGAARRRRRPHRAAGDRRADPRQVARRARRPALGGADAAGDPGRLRGDRRGEKRRRAGRPDHQLLK